MVQCHRDSAHFSFSRLILFRLVFFSHEKNVLRIGLFEDVLEVANPLGPKRGKHQIANFSFQILNLPPRLNALLDNMFVLAIAKTDDVKEHGFDTVLDSFMQELKELESEDGMLIEPTGKPSFHLRGTVVYVSADSKAFHELSSLMAAGEDKFCRACLISRKEIRFHATTRELILRSEDNYEEGLKGARLE